jgi:hypothetical protein
MAEIISIHSRKPIPQATIIYRFALEDVPENYWQVARWCKLNHRGRLTHKERRFVEDMSHRLVMNGQPTMRQADWLRVLYARLRKQTGDT